MGPDDEEIEIDGIEGDEQDAGLVNDQGGDDAEDGQEHQAAEGEEGEVKQSRGQRHFGRLREEARTATERAASLEREVAALRAERERERQQTQTQQETPDQRRARLALMSQDERIEYLLEESNRKHQQQLQAMQFGMADTADRAAYQAKAAYDPRYKKYEAEVEAALKAERDAGRDRGLTRDVVLRYIIGDKILANQSKTNQAREAGQRAIARQTTRPSAGGSGDQPRQRVRVGQGNSLADLEKRLEGVAL